MSEAAALKRVMVAASAAGARLFRNSVGYDRERKVTYGLRPGSSDLIGWTPVVVTPGMAGRRLAVFTAIEVKARSGRPTEAQAHFLAEVLKAGGIAFIETEPEAVSDKLRWFLAP